MNIKYSGNPIVDEVGGMKIIGNIIPKEWYKLIKRSNGKAHLLAIIILAEILYWYRPKEKVSNEDGSVTYERKFADCKYVRVNYEQLGEKFGVSRRQAAEAVEFLETTIKVLKRHLITIKGPNGLLPNVVHIELFPKRLKELTYPQGEEMSMASKGKVSNDEKKNNRHSDVKHITFKCETTHNKTGETTHFNEKGVALNCDTNTKITTKTSGVNSFNHSIHKETEGQKENESREVKSLISMQELADMFDYDELCKILSYDHLMQECRECQLEQDQVMERASDELKYKIDYETLVADGYGDMVDALVDYMSEIIAVNRSISFNGETYTSRTMGNQFYRLDYNAIKYVILKFDQASKQTEILNKKKYLIRMLVTAKSDMETGIKGDVNYDMAHWNEHFE